VAEHHLSLYFTRVDAQQYGASHQSVQHCYNVTLVTVWVFVNTYWDLPFHCSAKCREMLWSAKYCNVRHAETFHLC